MRKYLRSIARGHMKTAGVQRINKTRYMVNPLNGLVFKAPSFFAENWRKWA